MSVNLPLFQGHTMATSGPACGTVKMEKEVTTTKVRIGCKDEEPLLLTYDEAEKLCPFLENFVEEHQDTFVDQSRRITILPEDFL